jgi:hypothetical protein
VADEIDRADLRAIILALMRIEESSTSTKTMAKRKISPETRQRSSR